MPTPEQIQQVRFIEGVDRTEDSRLTHAGSWYATENLYGRSPGVLAKRPGSKLVVDGRPVYLGGSVLPPTAWDISVLKFVPGEVHLSDVAYSPATNAAKTTLFPSIPNNRRGTLGLRPKVNPLVPIGSTQLPTDAGKINLPFHRVAGLARLYFRDSQRFWVGAVNFEGGNSDRLFYITGTSLQLLPQELSNDVSIITTSGADFFFVPMRGGADEDDELSDPEIGYWMMGTNQVDAPFGLKYHSNGIPFPVPLEIGPYAMASDFPLSASDKRLTAVQSMCVWGSQVVYGGYRMQTATGSDTDVFDHHWAISDPGLPSQLAHVSGSISSFAVGDSDAEPITAVTTTAQPADTESQKAQLLVFTERRVRVYSGLPPVGTDPEGTDFTSNEFPIGCNAPRSVVRTPAGVVFLGSDGRFYLFAGGRPSPISVAVESTFRDLTPRQHKQVAAVWDQGEGYYKVSYPDVHAMRGSAGYRGGLSSNLTSFRPEHAVNDRQAWADMRSLGPGPDLGVRWYLPMIGMKHSCFAVADGVEDRGEIYAGSAVDGSIYHAFRSDYVTDPQPRNPTATTDIRSSGVTGLFDLGDAHVDKLVTALSFGFGTDRTAGISTSIIVNADNQALATQQVFTRTVTPTGDLIGSTFTIGTSVLSSPDAFELITERPSSRLRGKTFRFTFEETSGTSRLYYSDISFRAITAQRRI
jgi:hypothetical protein